MLCFRLALVGVSAICSFVSSSYNPPEYLSEKDLSQYISGNDKLSKSVASCNEQKKVTYKPTDLLVAQEIKYAPKNFRDHKGYPYLQGDGTSLKPVLL